MLTYMEYVNILYAVAHLCHIPQKIEYQTIQAYVSGICLYITKSYNDKFLIIHIFWICCPV